MDRAQSTRIISVDGRGLTDSDFASVSINNHASRRALSDRVGQDLSPLRFRGNIWVDGIDAWAEHDLVGKSFRIGAVEFEGVDRIERCMATTANPHTGERDAATLDALQSGWGHQDFGIFGRVTKAGKIEIGDTLEIL